MDFFDGRHYAINKGMLSLLGQWPYQSIRTKYIGLIILFFLAGTQIIAKVQNFFCILFEICAIVASFNEIDVVLNDMSPLIADSVATIQLINTAMKTEKMRELLNRVQIDYAFFTTDGEMKIILEYAENGRKFTIIYIGFFLVSMLIFIIPPLRAISMSSINGTIERPFIHHVEYFVDSQTFYYPIILHSCVTIFICVYIIVTVDTMFVLLVQHACALFKALGYRLHYITENGDDIMVIDLNPSKSNDKSYQNISECVRRHRDAIEFANLLESYYSTSLFLQAGFNMIELSITVFQATISVNETNELFQQVSVCYSTLTHILFQCVNGQRVIDHSDQMHEHLINMKWYHTSLRTRKVIYLMLIRSRVYCVLTAAKMFNMSMETFSTVKTILNRIEADYSFFTTNCEKEIISKYAENGRKFTIYCTVTFTMAMLHLMIAPLKGIFGRVNDTSKRPMLHHVEYFVDTQKYYYLIIFQTYVIYFIVCFSFAMVDTLFVVFVQHNGGLFKTLGYRLFHLIDEKVLDDDVLNPSKSGDKYYKDISLYALRHQKAIEFAELLDSFYSKTFFMISGLSMLRISVTGLKAVINVNNLKRFIQDMFICYTALIHVYFECMNGQRLIIVVKCTNICKINTEWYCTSLRTRKVTTLMTLRSLKPSILTAAGILNISLKTFCSRIINDEIIIELAMSSSDRQRQNFPILVYSRHSMNVMDFFDGRHYAINKRMLSLLGQWPYQSIRTKYVRLVILLLLLGTQMLAKVAATIISFRDRNVVLNDMAPLIADSTAVIRLINVTVKKEKMKILLNRMQTDYALFADDEMKIMMEYAENGRKFSIVYIGVFFVSMLQFMIPPLKSIILSNMNGSSERPLIHHVEYFVDSQRYYYLIILHSYAVIFICVFTIATMDTMFVVFVQHACGLFTAIGYQLRHIVDNNILLINLNPSKSNDKFYTNISKCIHRHQEAIQFANLLDKYYSTSFFLVSGISMIGMSITGLQAILNINKPKQFFQQMCVCYTTLIHVLFECVNGQRLIDHSSQMHEYLINTEWYRTSLRTRKGICFMLLRSQKSCTITAAKMFNISIETFTSIVRTSISYFTVLRSIQ
ncbi:uncharacterized protein LOC118440936 [Vespa mandarinia]|uniref:uncharacterized protein LOC118440936 n=1 Tax=Vespa mandarinia TaxID=7446 RepID=UPI001617DB89|nr:uncharacterized protein LOC118440936 [Vespa mandarinia]